MCFFYIFAIVYLVMDSAITFSTYEASKYLNNKYVIGLTFITILLIFTMIYYNPNINTLIIPSTIESKDVSRVVLLSLIRNITP